MNKLSVLVLTISLLVLGGRNVYADTGISLAAQKNLRAVYIKFVVEAYSYRDPEWIIGASVFDSGIGNPPAHPLSQPLPPEEAVRQFEIETRACLEIPHADVRALKALFKESMGVRVFGRADSDARPCRTEASCAADWHLLKKTRRAKIFLLTRDAHVYFHIALPGVPEFFGKRGKIFFPWYEMNQETFCGIVLHELAHVRFEIEEPAPQTFLYTWAEVRRSEHAAYRTQRMVADSLSGGKYLRAVGALVETYQKKGVRGEAILEHVTFAEIQEIIKIFPKAKSRSEYAVYACATLLDVAQISIERVGRNSDIEARVIEEVLRYFK